MTDPESPDTPSRFSRQETAHIQQMIVTPDAPIACPRCGGELVLGEPLAADPDGHVPPSNRQNTEKSQEEGKDDG